MQSSVKKQLEKRVKTYLASPDCSDKSVGSITAHLKASFPHEYSRLKEQILSLNVSSVLASYKIETSSSNSNTKEDEKTNNITSIKKRKREIKGESTSLDGDEDGGSGETLKNADTIKSIDGALENNKKKIRKKSPIAEVNEILKTTRLSSRPKVRYSDIGGIENILQDIRELLEYPLTHPEIYEHLGVDPPRGILLHGPPGCGKTLVANAVAGELGVSFFKVSSPEIVSGMSGESEEKLRALFEEAAANAPAIIFLDEIDAVTPHRETSSRGMEQRIVAQLLTCMDDLAGKTVMVVGATNRPDALDPALRRAGRFDREICLGIPDLSAREKIIRLMVSKMRVSEGMNFNELARCTPGFVGADLAAVAREAAVIAVNRNFMHIFSDINKVKNNSTTTIIKTSSTTTTNMNNESNINNDNNIEINDTQLESGVTEEDAGFFDEKDDVNEEEDDDRASEEFDLGEEDMKVEESNDEEMVDINETSASNINDQSKFIALNQVALDIRSNISNNLREVGRLTEAQLEGLEVTMSDFEEALFKVQPSSKREGFATVPNVTWNDIGALAGVREELMVTILAPIRNPKRFADLGLSVSSGILLYGPPGCGKTLLAKAIANESGSNFISVKGPELLNKYVGESEKAVRQVFQRANASAPCIVFFDELDALAPRRGGDGGGSGVSERVVNQLLTEMDGLETRRDVFVIAATNRPDILDPAILRPGRLDKILYVPFPTPQDRYNILLTLTRKTPMESDVDLLKIANDSKCERFSGADLSQLVREASFAALRPLLISDDVTSVTPKVTAINFQAALLKTKPSVSLKDFKLYNAMKDSLEGSLSGV